MTMDTPTLAWAILAIAAAVVEVLTPQFGFIFISAGAVAGALVNTFGGGLAWQLLSFAVIVTVSLTLIRPRMLGWLDHAPGVPSRTAPLIGKQGLVTETINPTLGTGRVTVAGEDWAARCRSAVADIDAEVTPAADLARRARGS